MLSRKMLVTCILYLIILPNLFCFPLNRYSNVKQLKRNKNVQSSKEKRIDENNTKAEIEEAELADNLNTFDVNDDESELKGLSKYKSRKTQESSSAIYIYIDGNLDKKRTVWRWSCLGLFFSIMLMVILLKFFYYNFDLGFYYANPEKTELLPDN